MLLGATAGKALLGSTFKLSGVRRRPVDSGLATLVTATAHPSAILRAPGDESVTRPAGTSPATSSVSRSSSRTGAADGFDVPSAWKGTAA